MNIKDIIKWSLKHWWWFVISVGVCCMIGGIYFLTTIPKFNVNAVLMLRQANNSTNQDEMLRMMGFGSNKITGDEVKVLTSRDLMGRVVDSLHLCTTYSQKGKRFWVEQFPQHALTVKLSEPQIKNVKVQVKVLPDKYKVLIQRGLLHKERLTVTSFDQPLQTFVGEVYIALDDTVKKGTYGALICPRIAVIDQTLKKILVNRLSRESNVITLTTKTTCPPRSIATINTLLDLYNLEAADDKTRLAVQTEQFLSNRLSVLAIELDQAESELEAYKRTQQIANLEKSASIYQQAGEEYEQKVIALDDQLKVLDLAAQVIPAFEANYELIPGNTGLSDPTVCGHIQTYNTLVDQRTSLLQTATKQNVKVKLLTEQIDQKKLDIQTSMEQLRKTLMRQRQFVQDQQNDYNSRLASIPETERRYLEMKRDKQTKENQYLYLIEKREENAMLLASEAVPAKVVERAQQDPNVVSPKIMMVGLASIFFGLALPLCFFFLGIIRKEYL